MILDLVEFVETSKPGLSAFGKAADVVGYTNGLN